MTRVSIIFNEFSFLIDIFNGSFPGFQLRRPSLKLCPLMSEFSDWIMLELADREVRHFR